MGHRNSEVTQEQIDWRRDKVLELAADGYSIREIESILKIPHATIHRDLVLLKEQAKEHIRKYIDERVPFEYQKTLAGLEGIIRCMSNIIATCPLQSELLGIEIGDFVAIAALIASMFTFIFGYVRTKNSEQIKTATDCMDRIDSRGQELLEYVSKERPLPRT
jgi:hypothetical protein